MAVQKEDVRDALRSVPAPGTDGDLVSTGALQWIALCENTASVKIHLPESTRPAWESTASAVGAAAAGVWESSGRGLDSLVVEFVDDAGTVVHSVSPARSLRTPHPPADKAPGTGPSSARPVEATGRHPAPTPRSTASALPGVDRIIAVGAGKGGVGKSTVAVNLAVALARRGHMVGLLDGDIYGPSLPTMLGLGGMDVTTHGGRLQPFVVHGIKSMTIGKLVDPEKPLIWRGPMAHGAFKQLTEQTNWGDLDYLVIDLPPGTGDVPLTMAQALRLTGAVVVCTPQRVAQDDAVRAARMFQQLGIPVLGVVENMSYFVCEHGVSYDIFGRGGAEQMAQRLGVPFLGSIPITPALRINSDRGDPSGNFAAGTELADSFERFATNLISQVTLESMRAGSSRPTLTIS